MSNPMLSAAAPGATSAGRRPFSAVLGTGLIVMPLVIVVGLMTDRPLPVPTDIDVHFLRGRLEPATNAARSTPELQR